ncbi:MAG: bifunctional diguanylate cyclase/phosphodiesterase [Hyphomicrobium sp.]
MLDIALLYLLLAVYADEYQLAPTAILKATTADAVFLLIVLRVVQFDSLIVAITGAAAVVGWMLLTVYAVRAAGPASITQSFVEYMTSDKALIGAQVERVLMIGLVTLVTTCALLLAHRDALTGLGNRTWFLSRLVDGHRASRRSRQAPALLLIEIDSGHALRAAGGYELTQQAVRRAAEQLAEVCTQRDLMARIGDCAFAILVPDLPDHATAHAFALRCLAAVEAGSELGGFSVKGRAAIGVAFGKPDGDAAVLWRDAQAALGAAMSSHCDHLVIFDERVRREAEHRLRLEADLRSALHLKQLELYYQPIARLSDQSVIGLEALMRWHHPQLGLVSPAVFIPIAEETGMITDLGAWAIGQAASDYKQLVSAGANPDLIMSVNVAPKQLEEWSKLEKAVQAALDSGCLLKLELTESMMSGAVDVVCERLAELASFGAQLAIDDFGTGYSSYGHLARMPLHTLKIDRSFTIGSVEPAGRAVVEGIISLARSLRLSVTAEGVETTEQLATLTALGANDFQGFLLSKPKPIAEIVAGHCGDRSGGAVTNVWLRDCFLEETLAH